MPEIKLPSNAISETGLRVLAAKLHTLKATSKLQTPKRRNCIMRACPGLALKSTQLASVATHLGKRFALVDSTTPHGWLNGAQLSLNRTGNDPAVLFTCLKAAGQPPQFARCLSTPSAGRIGHGSKCGGRWSCACQRLSCLLLQGTYEPRDQRRELKLNTSQL